MSGLLAATDSTPSDPAPGAMPERGSLPRSAPLAGLLPALCSCLAHRPAGPGWLPALAARSPASGVGAVSCVSNRRFALRSAFSCSASCASCLFWLNPAVHRRDVGRIGGVGSGSFPAAIYLPSASLLVLRAAVLAVAALARLPGGVERDRRRLRRSIADLPGAGAVAPIWARVTSVCTMAIVWAADVAAYFAWPQLRQSGSWRRASAPANSGPAPGALPVAKVVHAYGFSPAAWLPAKDPGIACRDSARHTDWPDRMLSIVGDLF